MLIHFLHNTVDFFLSVPERISKKRIRKLLSHWRLLLSTIYYPEKILQEHYVKSLIKMPSLIICWERWEHHLLSVSTMPPLLPFIITCLICIHTWRHKLQSQPFCAKSFTSTMEMSLSAKVPATSFIVKGQK